MQNELEILQDYIKSETGYEGDIDPNTDLLDTKILDSFSVVTMAVFLQDTFDLELEAEDLVRANLANLASMIALIQRRRNNNPLS